MTEVITEESRCACGCSAWVHSLVAQHPCLICQNKEPGLECPAYQQVEAKGNIEGVSESERLAGLQELWGAVLKEVGTKEWKLDTTYGTLTEPEQTFAFLGAPKRPMLLTFILNLRESMEFLLRMAERAVENSVEAQTSPHASGVSPHGSGVKGQDVVGQDIGGAPENKRDEEGVRRCHLCATAHSADCTRIYCEHHHDQCPNYISPGRPLSCKKCGYIEQLGCNYKKCQHHSDRCPNYMSPFAQHDLPANLQYDGGEYRAGSFVAENESAQGAGREKEGTA